MFVGRAKGGKKMDATTLSEERNSVGTTYIDEDEPGVTGAESLTKEQGLHIAVIVGCTFSIGAVILMLLSIVYFRRYRNVYWRLVAALALSDLCYAILFVRNFFI